MFKRFFIFNIVSLFILTIVCTIAIAQEKEEEYKTITGIVKAIDQERGMITIEKKSKSGNYDVAIKVSEQTKYASITGIDKLVPGDLVRMKCIGPKGKYEAVKVTKLKEPKF